LATNSALALPLRDFREDLAGIVYARPRLTVVPGAPPGQFQFQLNTQTGGQYLIQESPDLATWSTWQFVTNLQGTMLLGAPFTLANTRAFFRAVSN